MPKDCYLETASKIFTEGVESSSMVVAICLNSRVVRLLWDEIRKHLNSKGYTYDLPTRCHGMDIVIGVNQERVRLQLMTSTDCAVVNGLEGYSRDSLKVFIADYWAMSAMSLRQLDEIDALLTGRTSSLTYC